MHDFDRIDLMNFANYGNDFDSQWDEIRAYIKSSASAQRELEEIKKSLHATFSGNKKRDSSMNYGSGDPNEIDPPGQSSANRSSHHQTKSWWQKIIGD